MKENNKYKKIIIFIFIIIVLINVALFIYNIFINDKSSYIVIVPYNVIRVNNNSASVYKGNFNRLNYSHAKLYKNESEKEGYIVVKDDNQSEYKSVKFYNKSLAAEDTHKSIIYIGNNKIKNYTNLLSDDVSEKDINIVSDYLKDNSIGFIDDNTEIKIIKLNNKKIYVVSKIYIMDAKNNFSVIFSKENDNYELIYLRKGKTTLEQSSTVSNIVDINNDNNVDLILESAPYGTDVDYCYSVYLFDNKSNSYKPVINCEED